MCSAAAKDPGICLRTTAKVKLAVIFLENRPRLWRNIVGTGVRLATISGSSPRAVAIPEGFNQRKGTDGERVSPEVVRRVSNFSSLG